MCSLQGSRGWSRVAYGNSWNAPTSRFLTDRPVVLRMPSMTFRRAFACGNSMYEGISFCGLPLQLTEREDRAVPVRSSDAQLLQGARPRETGRT
jgi:hypothetical protein